MVFKQIASFDNYLLAHMTLGLLQEHNINCHLKDEHIITIDPLLSPAVGGIKLMVAENESASAAKLLRSAEEEYLKQFFCSQCGSNSLTIEEKIDIPVTFLQKLKNKILFGQSQTYQKKYRCRICNSLSSELPVILP